MKFVVMNRLITGATEFGTFRSLKSAMNAVKGMECKDIYRVANGKREKVYSI